MLQELLGVGGRGDPSIIRRVAFRAKLESVRPSRAKKENIEIDARSKRQNRKCVEILESVDSPLLRRGKGSSCWSVIQVRECPATPAAPFIYTPPCPTTKVHSRSSPTAREPVARTIESQLPPLPTFAGSALPTRSRVTVVLFCGAGEELKARRPPCPASARPSAHAWPLQPRARTHSASSSSRPPCGPHPRDLVGSRSSAAASRSVAAGTAPVAAGDAAGLGS